MRLFGDKKKGNPEYVVWWVYDGIAHRLIDFSQDSYWSQTRIPGKDTYERTACGEDVHYGSIPAQPETIMCGACKRVVLMLELAQ